MRFYCLSSFFYIQSVSLKDKSHSTKSHMGHETRCAVHRRCVCVCMETEDFCHTKKKQLAKTTWQISFSFARSIRHFCKHLTNISHETKLWKSFFVCFSFPLIFFSKVAPNLSHFQGITFPGSLNKAEKKSIDNSATMKRQRYVSVGFLFSSLGFVCNLIGKFLLNT